MKHRDTPEGDFRALIAAPARRALESKGIQTLRQLSKFSETEIAALHGMGPNAISKLKTALQEKGFSFKK
jgi:hypothetical protein